MHKIQTQNTMSEAELNFGDDTHSLSKVKEAENQQVHTICTQLSQESILKIRQENKKKNRLQKVINNTPFIDCNIISSGSI